ncbi:lysophospholipid acyltransferase family protein [Phyllobacterium sp. 22229]|uniref:Glycerol acyltransferase n=2 Tax=Pseudomonadota TaxID=1224 RepID=A0A2S9JZI8_9HYPH|nr:lysophospholipid acyltransferase family protein [Phyllobacterium myrsinacearum]PRD58751.1 glycerol acyltransferase [Phyllobacterium myrsinacearum]PWV97029.1 putative hemolysin [Phyllobacterium myrsinacearum]RZS88992.1 putative hemolysin [Phyllobacterium myrsinacearum]RZV08980.1 putative hemolysin [Phyllobacterium myrsinacearum]
MQFRELSYANDTQSRITQWLIRSIEGLSGRDHYVRLYNAWRTDIVPAGIDVFCRMMDLINIRLDVADQWPPQHVPDTPLVIVANHPFGIGDGIAALALAEQLGRPFRVLINNDLMKVPEIRPYALPVCFDETKEAVAMNMATRHEAVRLLKEGVTIVVFPAGGVATAPKGFGRAEDLPWKIFPAKLVQQAKASVIPVYFGGQNGRVFHLASKISMTLRISLLIREFRKLSGKAITVRIGRTMDWPELAPLADRKHLLDYMYDAVFALAPVKPQSSGSSPLAG